MHRFTHTHDSLIGPPVHVLAEVDAAWERAQELADGELELHFTQTLLSGRVAGELRLGDGSWSSGSRPPRRSPSPAATPRWRSPRRSVEAWAD
jgi:hypothetical protein